MYICTLRCPHFAEPCEMETAEYERIASYKEPCPIGEDDSFRYVDESNMFICLVVGSRSFTDYSLFCMKMDKILSSKADKTLVILSGGAQGTDSLAERYARKERSSFYVCLLTGKKGKSLVLNEMRRCTSIWLLIKTVAALHSGPESQKGQCTVLHWQKNIIIRSE